MIGLICQKCGSKECSRIEFDGVISAFYLCDPCLNEVRKQFDTRTKSFNGSPVFNEFYTNNKHLKPLFAL